MNQSMLKLFNNKNILTSIILLFIIIQCQQQEKKGIDNNKTIKYIGSNTIRKLNKEHQSLVFGKWKFTHIVFIDDTKKIEKEIKVNEDIILNNEGIFNTKYDPIAETHESIGTYKFKSLDSLNTIYYIYTLDKSHIMMQNSVYRFVNGKLTKGRARVYLYFSKKD